MKKLKAKISI